MSGAEGVVHVEVCEGGQLPAEEGVVLLFAGMEADVFKEQDVAVLERGHLALDVITSYSIHYTKLYELLHPILEERVKNTRWVVTRFPTYGAAQDARMSLAEYEDFFFAACNVDWDAESRKQERLKALLDRTDEVRIVASDTDLRFSVAGMGAVKCDGRFNIPDGEVFTAPVRESVEGVITFNAPTLYGGREFNQIV